MPGQSLQRRAGLSAYQANGCKRPVVLFMKIVLDT
jgi:hypothetical protein